MNERLQRVTWQIQTLLFCTVFWILTYICSVPADVETFTRPLFNGLLEDFGVFLLFLAIWCGVYAHFKRDISLPWLVLLLLLALWQEEINLLNKLYQTANYWFGREVDSAERQRGDVIVLMVVALSLIPRFLQRGFRSLFRIHITFFLVAYTVFQIWVHTVFPYQMQQAIIEPYIEYQKEFTSTYPGRFDYQCAQGKWVCYSWVGDDMPEAIANDSDLVGIVRSHADVSMNTMGYLASKQSDSETIFRGVDASDKYIVTYMKNHDLNRVVMNFDSVPKATAIVTGPLLIFTTSFGMIWFFGGVGLVLMHQQMFSRNKS